MLDVRNLSAGYDGRPILQNLSFCVRENEWWMLLGRNGVGKSTLIKALAHLIPYQGRVSLNGKDTNAFSRKALALQVGVLSQRHQVQYAYTVEELVHLGRYAHRGFLAKKPDRGGEERIHNALRATGMLSFRKRSLLTLSGGELQRAFLSQVLAQDPAILLLDEPNTALDLSYQKDLYQFVADWVKKPGKAVVSAVHDISYALRFGTHALLLDGDKNDAGAIRSVMNPENLERAYRMDVCGWMRGMYALWADESWTGENRDGIMPVSGEEKQ